MFECIGTRKRQACRPGQSHSLRKVTEVFAYRQGRGSEYPRLVTIVDESAQGIGYIQRRQVEPDTARIDIEPSQAIPTIFTRQVRETFDRGKQLFIEFVDFRGCIP